jgi:cysteine desulfurase
MREVYADAAATTRPAPEVVAAMTPFLGERFGNPSSVHARGEAAREAVESARAAVAELIGGAAEEIVFTASGSEANNLALQGAMAAAPPGRTRIVVSAIEHPSVLETARALAARGVALTVVPPGPDGAVDPDRIGRELDADVAVVSLMWANNETGVIQPIEAVAAKARAAGALVHCDAVQAVGKLPVDAPGTGVDLLSLAGHKFHGPAGAAALWVRRRTRLVPVIHGGRQERGRRAGTENLAAIAGLGTAARLAAAWLAAGGPLRLAALGERLAGELLARVPGAVLHGADARRVPWVVSLGFRGVDGEAVLHELDRAGVTVSTGSACSAAEPGPSHVLVAMGLRPEDAHASVRFSLGRDATDEEVDVIVSVTPEIVGRLRALAGEPARRSA